MSGGSAVQRPLRACALRIVAAMPCVLVVACGASAPAAAPPASAPARPSEVVSATRATEPQPEKSRQPALVAPFGTITVAGEVDALKSRAKVNFLLRSEDSEGLLARYAAVHPEARRVAEGVMMGEGALPEAVLDRHRAPSFLVDFDQPAIAELAAKLAPDARVDAIRQQAAAVFENITNGTFWTASRAATLRAGDCTEHAVVAAALARARGLPARVVLGYVLLPYGDRAVALGHAWTEVHDGTRWLRVDATPIGNEAHPYLIEGELLDEGPSFAMSLLGAMAMLRVQSIDIVRAAPEPAAAQR